ncbi:MAG: tripartite tricarboxylate transporter permease [Methanobacteriota archaeon]
MGALLFALGGAVLGAVAGLVPGLHPNALALLALGAAAAAGGPSGIAVAAAIVAATVAHGAVSALQAIFLAAPDEDSALSVLPGHRLVQDGKGFAAGLLSAKGAFYGSVLAILLLLPIRFLLGAPVGALGTLRAVIPALLLFLAVLFVVVEPHEVAYVRAVRPDFGGVRRVPGSEPVREPNGAFRGRVERVAGADAVVAGPRGRVVVLDATVWTGPLAPGDEVDAEGTPTYTTGPASRALAVGAAALVFLLSGAYGLVLRGLPAGSPFGLPGSVLFPALTGLFAVPALALAARSPRPPPPQPRIPDAEPPRRVFGATVVGVLAAPLVAFVPGLTASQAATVAFLSRPTARAEEALVTLSAVGAAVSVFDLGAWFVASRARSGALIAAEALVPGPSWVDAAPPSEALALLAAALVGAGVGALTIVAATRVLADRSERVLSRRTNLAVLVFLVLLVAAFTGPIGVAVLGVGATIGALPWMLGIRRGHLVGVLLVPVLAAHWGGYL